VRKVLRIYRIIFYKILGNHQWIDYRSLKGIVRALEKLGHIPRCDDYTTSWYRIHGMEPKMKLPGGEEAEIAADGTGFKSGSAGEYKTYICKNKGGNMLTL